MIAARTDLLSSLYEADETAWLESMAEIVRHGRWDELDYGHLGEYLSDMARRDRREVESRLTVLLTHHLKWTFQPDKRSGSWHGTIIAQRRELAKDAGKGVLRKHAENMLAQAYADSVEEAAAETGLAKSTFPSQCPWSFDDLLSGDILKNG